MRLLVIGLDGATWTVLDPLLKAGRLPNLSRLIEDGARCVCTAFEPILSPVIWTSLASGKRPDKHGITHFYHTASNVRCNRLWDILVRPDRPVGVFAWPVTWPPRPIHGFVVPSLFARANDTFPAELAFVKELEAGLRKGWRERLQLIKTAMRHGLRPTTVARMTQYVIAQKLGYYGVLERYAEQRLLKLEVQLDIYASLVKSYRPYFTSFYMNQIDAFSHRFWRYYEPHRYPDVTEAEAKRYGDTIARAYEIADRAVGRVISLASADTLVVVVSDHGFEGADTGTRARRFCGRVRGSVLLDILGLTDEANYVNHRDWIIVNLSKGAEHRRSEILGRLSKFRVRELGAPLLDVTEDRTGEIVIKVYARTHLYRDDVDVDALHIDYAEQSIPFVKLVRPEYDTRVSGIHHLDGIAILSGPGVRAGSHVTKSSVLDIAPTILALLGMPVGSDMDGRALTELIEPAFLAETPLTYVDTYDTDVRRGESADSEPVSEELMDRLRALGYVD